MDKNTLSARVVHKHDVEVAWLESKFIPRQAEIVIYDIEVDAEGNVLVDAEGNPKLPQGRTEPYTYERIKIGDGVHNVNELPFANEDLNIINGESLGSIAQVEKNINYTENKTYAENGTAFGRLNIAGSKGYSLSAATGTDGREGTYTLNVIPDPAILGKNFSIYLKSNRYQIGTVTAIEENVITVDNMFLPTGWDELDSDGLYPITYGYIYFADDPTLGDINIGTGAHTEGYNNKAILVGSHAEGAQNVAEGKYAHAEGRLTYAGYAGHAEGRNTKAIGEHAHAEGHSSQAIGNQSHAQGHSTRAIGVNSTAAGQMAEAIGKVSSAIGYYVKAVGNYTMAEGSNSIALGGGSYAGGIGSSYNGEFTKAAIDEYWEINKNINAATGYNDRVFGSDSLASGGYSLATGFQTHAAAESSSTFGRGTVASARYQTALGRWNSPHNNALFVVGNGSSDDQRSNAFVVNSNGSATIGAEPVNDFDITNKKFVEDRIDSKIASKAYGDPNKKHYTTNIMYYNKSSDKTLPTQLGLYHDINDVNISQEHIPLRTKEGIMTCGMSTNPYDRHVANVGYVKNYVTQILASSGTLTKDQATQVVKINSTNAKFDGTYDSLVNKAFIPTALSHLSSSANYRTVTDAEKEAWNNKLDKAFPESPQSMSAKTFTPGWWMGYIEVKDETDAYMYRQYSLGTFYIPECDIGNYRTCEVSVWNDKIKRRIEIDCNTGNWTPYNENGAVTSTTVYAVKIQ